MSAAKINKFLDVRAVLDAALTQNAAYGEVVGRVPTETRGQAVHWRQRAYTFMKLFRETRDANSQYERLTFPMIGQDEPEDGWGVTIKMAGRGFGFIPSSEARAPMEPIDDPLLAAAREVARKVQGDGI